MKKYAPLLSLSLLGLLPITLYGMNKNSPQQYHNGERPINTSTELFLKQKALIRKQLQKKEKSDNSDGSHSHENYGHGYVDSSHSSDGHSSDSHSDSDTWFDRSY